MQYNTELIKLNNPLQLELAKYAIEPNSKGFTKCPFHNEKTASFKVYKDGTYHCFGCGEHGDVITLTMKMQHLSFNRACETLSGEVKYSQIRKAEKIQRQNSRANLIREKVRKGYFAALSRYLELTSIIKTKRPSGPDATPAAEWLRALSEISLAEMKLSLAETVYILTEKG